MINIIIELDDNGKPIVELGTEFPISDEHRKDRAELADILLNAVNCLQHDPIGGNAGALVEMAYERMKNSE